MAKIRQRTWRVRGQRTKRKAWGFVTVENGNQVRCFKAEWTKEDAENALAARLLKIDQEPKVKAAGLTLAQAAERYLATKARKRSLAKDRRTLEHFKSMFGADAALADITASRISEYKAQRLAATSVRRKDAQGNGTLLSAAAVNRPLALLRHLLRLTQDEGRRPDTGPGCGARYPGSSWRRSPRAGYAGSASRPPMRRPGCSPRAPSRRILNS